MADTTLDPHDPPLLLPERIESIAAPFRDADGGMTATNMRKFVRTIEAATRAPLWTRLAGVMDEQLRLTVALEQAQRERDEAREERDTEQALRARYLRERDEARAALEALTAHHHSIAGAAAQEAQR